MTENVDVQENSEDADLAGYTFVFNISEIVGATEVELIPKHFLRKATREQILEIKEDLAGYENSFHPDDFLKGIPWESIWPAENGRLIRSSQEDWRYHVINFEGNNGHISTLEEAFLLAERGLVLGSTFIRKGNMPWGKIYHPSMVFHVMEQLRPFNQWEFFSISQDEITEYQKFYQLIQNHDKTLVDIHSLLQDMRGLNAISYRSPLRFLGYFALLESILTHQPKPNDPYDSITRQVIHKLALLNNRFPRPIDYTPFRNAKPDTIWKRMYDLRSSIAHGGKLDFSGDRQILGSLETAFQLLQQTTKAVIRQALIEPQLIVDLREC